MKENSIINNKHTPLSWCVLIFRLGIFALIVLSFFYENSWYSQ